MPEARAFPGKFLILRRVNGSGWSETTRGIRNPGDQDETYFIVTFQQYTSCHAANGVQWCVMTEGLQYIASIRHGNRSVLPDHGVVIASNADSFLPVLRNRVHFYPVLDKCLLKNRRNVAMRCVRGITEMCTGT